MHFWIDKRSQGCGFSGRRLMVTSGYGLNNQRSSPACAYIHPKPMVTPVHRFQSIESVANNGLRVNNRGCSRAHWNQWQCRPHQPPTVHFNGSSSNIRSPQSSIRPTPNMITAGPTPTPRRNNTPTAKLKCGVWIFFVIITLLLAAAKYYFHGVSIGIEGFAFCSLLVAIFIIGGLITLYEAITATANNPDSQITITDNYEEDVVQVANQLSPPSSNSEMPPPPYNIAIMLPSHNDDSIQVIRDSPPPSYEKAVS